MSFLLRRSLPATRVALQSSSATRPASISASSSSSSSAYFTTSTRSCSICATPRIKAASTNNKNSPATSSTSSTIIPDSILQQHQPRRHFLGVPGSLTGLIATQPAPDGNGTIPVILVPDFKKIRKDFDVVVDVREKAEVDEGMIPGAVHMPLATVLANPQRAELKGKKVLVYCKAGIRSAKAVQALQHANIDAVNLGGGYSAWLGDK